jgi:hypothetical protein
VRQSAQHRTAQNRTEQDSLHTHRCAPLRSAPLYRTQFIAPIKTAASPSSQTVAADGKTASPTAADPPTPMAAAMLAAGTGPHSIAFSDRPAPIHVCVLGGGCNGTGAGAQRPLPDRTTVKELRCCAAALLLRCGLSRPVCWPIARAGERIHLSTALTNGGTPPHAHLPTRTRMTTEVAERGG